jgi:hypothetical protein
LSNAIWEDEISTERKQKIDEYINEWASHSQERIAEIERKSELYDKYSLKSSTIDEIFNSIANRIQNIADRRII